MSSCLGAVLAFLLSLVSWIFYRKTIKHKLSIGHVSLTDLSLRHVHYQASAYNDTYHFRFSAARIYLRFHIPRRPNPRWMTFTAEGIFFTSETSEMSSSQLSVAFWFFPLLFGQTAGPWTNVELDDCRVRIMRSDQTPSFIKRLRESLVSAAITGEVLRADDFKTSVQFQGLVDPIAEPKEYVCGEADESEDEDSCSDQAIHVLEATTCYCGHELTIPLPDPDGNIMSDDHFVQERKKNRRLRRLFKGTKLPPHPPSLCHADDEMCLSSGVRGLQLHNCEGRIYAFSKIDAQLRRNWTADRGTFVMVAEECRWVRVPWRHRMSCVYPWWRQLIASMMHFPYDLVHIYHNPMSALDLYVPRVDIVFDEFRIRDAELIMQSFSLMREKTALNETEWHDLLLDTFTSTILGALSSS